MAVTVPANSATQLVQNRMHATTDNTGGGARLYSENRMLNQTVTADRSYPIAIVHGYRGLNVSNYVPGDGTTMGMSKYTMLGFLGNVAGWYEWNGDTWTGKTNGIVMEFSTAGVGGSAAAVSFSTAAGKHSTNEAACSWTNASSYPVYWKVEYATSADGATWSDYTEAVNAATGERGFEMRSLPWCINNSSTRTSVFDTANQSGVYTQSDFGFGLVPYRFVLPAEVLGKAKVRAVSAWYLLSTRRPIPLYCQYRPVSRSLPKGNHPKISHLMFLFPNKKHAKEVLRKIKENEVIS